LSAKNEAKLSAGEVDDVEEGKDDADLRWDAVCREFSEEEEKVLVIFIFR